MLLAGAFTYVAGGSGVEAIAH